MYAWLLERNSSRPLFVQQARQAVAAATTSVWPHAVMLPRSTQRTMLMPCGQMWDSCAYPAGHPVRSSNHTFVLGDRGLCMLREASPLVHQLMSLGYRTFALSVGVARPDPEDDTHLPVFNQFDFASMDESGTTVDELYPAQQQLAQQFQDQVMRAAGVLVSQPLRAQPKELPEFAPGTGFEISANLGGMWVEIASGGLKSLEALRVAGLVQGQNVYAFGGHVSWGLERVAMVLNGASRIQDVDN